MSLDVSHIDAWIFDLDNTLYPAKCDLFALIDARMGEYIQRLAGAMRSRQGGCRKAGSATMARRCRG